MMAKNKKTICSVRNMCLLVLLCAIAFALIGGLTIKNNDGLSIKKEIFIFKENEMIDLSPELFVNGDKELIKHAKLDIIVDENTVRSKKYNSNDSLVSLNGIMPGEYEGVVSSGKKEVTFTIIVE